MENAIIINNYNNNNKNKLVYIKWLFETWSGAKHHTWTASFKLLFLILINAYKMSTQRDRNINIPSFIRHHSKILRQLFVADAAPIIYSLCVSLRANYFL